MSDRISIAIVTHNNATQVQKLLESMERVFGGAENLLGQASGDEFLRVFVVDNASSDDSAGLVERGFPWVTVLRNLENRGFGAGHNTVLPLLDSLYHAVVNPDIEFTEDTLSPLVAYLDAHSEIGQITPRIMNPDGSEQKLPKLRPHLRYLVARRLERLGGTARRLSEEYVCAGKGLEDPLEVEFCTGSFFVIRTELFERLGGFDEDYFMYFEDCDLSCRVRESGARIVFYPGTEVVHYWSRDSAKHAGALFTHLRSMFKFFAKQGW